MKKNRFINIQSWMVSVLGLKDKELIVFSVVYGFNQDKESEYRGGYKYICDFLGWSRPTATRAFNNLVEKGLIIKRVETISGVSFNRYTVNEGVVTQLYMACKDTLHGTCKDTLHKDINMNKEGISNTTPQIKEIIVKDSIEIKTPQPPEKKIPSNKKISFHDSKWNNIENVRAHLLSNKRYVEKYKGVDLSHYIEKVGAWCDKSGKKTTDRGWIAYIRDFMSSDIDAGKLYMKKKSQKRRADFTVDELASERNQGGHINF